MATDPKLTEVISYLRNEFPGFAVTCLESGEFESVLRLKSPDQIHMIRVQESFLKDMPISDIGILLADFRLAQTLRDLGDFPIVITVNGCIFGW